MGSRLWMSIYLFGGELTGIIWDWGVKAMPSNIAALQCSRVIPNFPDYFGKISLITSSTWFVKGRSKNKLGILKHDGKSNQCIQEINYALHKKLKFHVFLGKEILWKHSFCNLSQTMRKLCVCTRSPDQKIRWNYGILRSEETTLQRAD